MESDYKKYYYQENYVRENVYETFRSQGFIGAFDFFCIIIWKANRAKSYIAENLVEIEPDLEKCCKELTGKLFKATDEERLKILIKDYKFRLPIASAILSIFYPENFCIYDVRVCGELATNANYAKLNYVTNFKKLWDGYKNYIEAVRGIDTPIIISNLIEKDQYLWGKSFHDQLVIDIEAKFPRKK
jgi:hypothetical protein